MNLQLKRKTFSDNSTIGELGIDGQFECFTLEDVVRPAGEKVYGKTAIPTGTYQIIITHSPHFGRDLPLLIDVPDFEGVRIHPGNTAADTEGCILVGVHTGEDQITDSRTAFGQLFDKIKAATGTQEISITIE